MKPLLSKAVSYLLYPALLALTLLVIYSAIDGQWDLKRTLWGYLFGLLLVLIPVERLFSLTHAWDMTRASFLRDLKYLALSGVSIALLRTGFGTLAIWFGEHHQGLLANVPVAASVVIFFMVFEFLQYWLHRLSHQGRGALGRFLWRVHLAHHLPDRVYVVMHGVFHPVNALLTALLIQSSMLLLGLSPQAAFAATLLIDLQTMISHFNVDLRAGVFNYLFIGTELHRYHHSARLEESRNYGAVIPLWDLVFGTFLYQPAAHPARLGLDGSGEYPSSQNLWQVLALPFHRHPAAIPPPSRRMIRPHTALTDLQLSALTSAKSARSYVPIMTDRELLVEHLASALADAEAGRDDYFEVAALAGLLERCVATDRAAASLAEHEVLVKAHALRVDGTLRARLPEPAAAADIAEQLLESSGEYDEQDRRDMLLDLDELCAGAWFAGEADRFAAATQELAAAMYAHPDSWHEQASWVAVVLASAPPLPDDRMLTVFRAIAMGAQAHGAK